MEQGNKGPVKAAPHVSVRWRANGRLPELSTSGKTGVHCVNKVNSFWIPNPIKCSVFMFKLISLQIFSVVISCYSAPVPAERTEGVTPDTEG